MFKERGMGKLSIETASSFDKDCLKRKFLEGYQLIWRQDQVLFLVHHVLKKDTEQELHLLSDFSKLFFLTRSKSAALCESNAIKRKRYHVSFYIQCFLTRECCLLCRCAQPQSNTGHTWTESQQGFWSREECPVSIVAWESCYRSLSMHGRLKYGASCCSVMLICCTFEWNILLRII